MKKKRQERIAELIGSRPIETQEELQSLLTADGFVVTQATVSRDIREMGVVKTTDHMGRYRYQLHTEKTASTIGEKFTRIFREAAKSVDFAANLIVIKSYSGTGNAVGAAIDAMSLDGVIGTLAGDDTLLIVVRTQERAFEIAELLNAHIKAE